MNQEIKLTLEQEFNLRSFTDIVKQMSREQAQEFLVKQQKLMMIREAMYRELIMNEWQANIESSLSQ